MKLRNFWVLVAAVLLMTACSKPSVEVTLPENPTNQAIFAAGHLTDALLAAGYEVVETGGEQQIVLTLDAEADLKKEGFRIQSNATTITVTGKDGNGLLYGCRELIDRMEAEGGGAILNVASSAGLFPAGPYMAGYYATKAYMASLTRAVAEELRQAKSPVYVSCLCPGPVNTEFNEVADVSFALPGISVQECVDYALRMMERRQTVIVPGREIRAAVFGQRFIPAALTVRVAAAQQKKKNGLT
jgi:NAD(P)-dependent dehydrogenase (short-subunit alcohol dehydrogenase family)